MSFLKESARVTAVRKRARGGTERRIWCKNAVVQLGTSGWSSAHDRLEIDGCAGPVIGEMDFTAAGRVFRFEGFKIGEMNGLYPIRTCLRQKKKSVSLTATAGLQ